MNSHANQLLGRIRNVLPLARRELVLACGDAMLHTRCDGLGWRFGVERWIATQHDVHDHAQTPDVTALRTCVQYTGSTSTCMAHVHTRTDTQSHTHAHTTHTHTHTCTRTHPPTHTHPQTHTHACTHTHTHTHKAQTHVCMCTHIHTGTPVSMCHTIVNSSETVGCDTASLSLKYVCSGCGIQLAS